MTEQEIKDASFAVLNALTSTKKMKPTNAKDRNKLVIAKFAAELERRVPGLSAHVVLVIHGDAMAPLADSLTGASIMRQVLNRLGEEQRAARAK